jgi:multiple sugar transport system ATP-binding protein
LHTTTVYVTHDQVEAMTLGDRVAVLRGGMLQQFGSPGMSYEHPVNIFVAGFIGSPSMNFLEAELSHDRLQTPLGEVNLSDALRLDLESVNVDRHLIMGVRPEHFEDPPWSVLRTGPAASSSRPTSTSSSHWVRMSSPISPFLRAPPLPRSWPNWRPTPARLALSPAARRSSPG